MDDQSVPYRPMPLGYMAVWVGLHILLLGFRHAQTYGWPISMSFEQFIGILAGSIAGGLFWGWIAWKFWLYKRFPAGKP